MSRSWKCSLSALSRTRTCSAIVTCIALIATLLPPVPTFAAEVTIDSTVYDVTRILNASPRVVFINDTDGYAFYNDSDNDLVYSKTTDGGDTWSDPPTEIDPGSLAWWDVAIWYDQWTPGDTSGTKIHIGGVEATQDDVWYTYLDTSDDSLRSGGWVNAGAPGGAVSTYYGSVSITKSTDDYLFVSLISNTSADIDIYKSIDDGDNWTDTSITPTAAFYRDRNQLLPLGDGDIINIYHDTDASLYYYEYDEGTDTWGSRQTLDSDWGATYNVGSFGASVYKTTGDIYLAGSNDPNITGNDVRAYKFTDSSRTWSQLTDVLTNETEAGQATMLIDQNNGDLYAAYLYGTSFGSSMDVYYKKSTDDGSSWSSATQINSTADDIRELFGGVTSDDRLYVVWENDDLNDLLGNTVADLTPVPQGPTHYSTISGTVYSDAGVTNIGAGKLVGVAINGSKSTASGSTNGSGEFTIADIPNSTTGATVAVFLDDETEKAVTMTLTDGMDITGVDLYQNHIIVRSDSGSVNMTNTLLDEGDGGDTDITDLFSISSSELHINNSYKLYIPSGETFAPGERIKGHDLEVVGTLTLGTNGLTLSGSLTANAGTLTTSTGVTIDPQDENDESLKLGSNTFSDLILGTAVVGGGGGGAAENPYQDISPSPIQNSTHAYNFGYRFEPQVDGEITQLWGNCGTADRTIRLYSCDNASCTTGTEILSESISTTGVGNWVSVDITPTEVTASSDGYVVAMIVDTSGPWCYESRLMPFTQGEVQVVDSRYATSATFPTTAQTSTMYGVVDITFYPGGVGSGETGIPKAASGSVRLGSALDVNGTLTLGDTELSSGNAYGINVSGDWYQAGGLLNSTGTVTLDGTNQTMSGATRFYNLTKTVASADTLYMDYLGVQAVSGALTLQGASSNLLSLRTHKSGSAAKLTLDSAGTQSLTYLDVQDSDAGSGETLTCSTGCSEGTNNTNWSFGPPAPVHMVDISGTVYTDEGATNIGASKTVAVAVNGTKFGTTDETDGSGQFSISDVEANTGAVITLFLDDEAEDAATVTLTDGFAMTNINLYQDRLIVRSDSGSVALTNTHLATGDGGDSDILSIFSVDGSNVLNMAPGKELYVWTGDTYTPGARVKTHDLEVLGTMTLGTNGLTISGSLVTNAGTLTTSTGVMMNPDGDNDEILNPGANTFNDLVVGSIVETISQSSIENPYQAVSPSATVGGVISSTYGYRFTPLVNGTVTQLWANCSSATRTLKLWTCDNASCSTGTQVRSVSMSTTGVGNWVAADITPYNVIAGEEYVVTEYAASADYCYEVRNPPFTEDNIEIVRTHSTTGDTFPTGSYTTSMQGLVDISFYASSDIEIPRAASGSIHLGSALDINGTLTLGDTELHSGNAYNINVSGDWYQAGGLLNSTGTVTLDGTNQTMSGATRFYNLTKTVASADTLYMDYLGVQAVSGALTLQGASSNLLSLRTHKSGSAAKLTLDSAGTQSLTYLDVQDSTASGVTLNCLTGCTEGTNNTNWNFGAADAVRNFFFFFGF